MRRPVFVSCFLFVALLPISGCSAKRRHAAGAECELSSECSAPLVCRIGYCRNECATSGDCREGLACVLDQDGLGACQRESEVDCALTTDCPAPLVCRLRQCVNECAEDRDCLGGARCQITPDGSACIDTASAPCVGDGECRQLGDHLFCLAGRCREECFADRDCRRGLVCEPTLHACMASDARDAGMRDGGALDGGALDGGALDGGALDGGFDAGGSDAGARSDAGADGGSDAGTARSMLLVRLVNAGSVTSSPPGIACSGFFGMTVDCPPATFGGSVVLTAAPDGAFGYTDVLWTGDCSTIAGFDCTVDSGAGAVRACFHAGDSSSCTP